MVKTSVTRLRLKTIKIDSHDCHVGVWGEQLSVYPKFHFHRVWRKTVFRLALWGSCKHDVLAWKVLWLDSRESFSYSTLYFSNLNFPNLFPRNFTCPTGEWWTKSTNPTTNYISYSPGLSDMAFFASLFQDNFCEIIPVWFNKGCQQNNWNICRWCFIAETNHQCFRAESCCTLSYLWFV